MTKLYSALFAALLFGSCSSIAPPAKPGTVDHVVIVWLKRPGNAQDKQALIETGRELRSIPGIHFLDSGSALPSERAIVDDSFDVAFVMRFHSISALEAYAVHPKHAKAKRNLAKLSRKMVIYDVIR
jgi:hypothetical protein